MRMRQASIRVDAKLASRFLSLQFCFRHRNGDQGPPVFAGALKITQGLLLHGCQGSHLEAMINPLGGTTPIADYKTELNQCNPYRTRRRIV